MWNLFGGNIQDVKPFGDVKKYQPIATQNVAIGWMDGMSQIDKDKTCRELFQALFTVMDANTIKSVIVKYDADVIVDTIKKYANKDCICNNIEILIPTTKSDIIHTLVQHKYDVIILERITPKIDPNILDREGCNALWYTLDIDYICELVSSKVLNFDVNHKNKKYNTFFRYQLYFCDDKTNYDALLKLIQILIDKQFNFKDSLCYYVCNKTKFDKQIY